MTAFPCTRCRVVFLSMSRLHDHLECEHGPDFETGRAALRALRVRLWGPGEVIPVDAAGVCGDCQQTRPLAGYGNVRVCASCARSRHKTKAKAA